MRNRITAGFDYFSYEHQPRPVGLAFQPNRLNDAVPERSTTIQRISTEDSLTERFERDFDHLIVE